MNQNDLLVASYRCCFDSEVDANRWQTSFHKSIFNQPGQNAGFTDPRVTQNNDFTVWHLDPIEFVSLMKFLSSFSFDTFVGYFQVPRWNWLTKLRDDSSHFVSLTLVHDFIITLTYSFLLSSVVKITIKMNISLSHKTFSLFKVRSIPN